MQTLGQDMTCRMFNPIALRTAILAVLECNSVKENGYTLRGKNSNIFFFLSHFSVGSTLNRNN